MSAYAQYLQDRDHEARKALFRAMAASAGFHLLVLGIAALAGYITGGPRLFDEKSISVRFVTPPARPRPAVVEVKPEPVKTIAKPELKPEPAPEKKLPAAKKEEEKKPKEEKEEEPETPPMSEDKARDIDLARDVIAQSGQGPAQAEWEEAVEVVESDVRMSRYRDEVGVAVKDAWVLPVTVPVNQGLHFDVLVQVDSAGNVLAYKVLHPSGNADMDRSVEALMENLKKLPPLPYPPAGSYQEIPLRFVPEDMEW